MALAALVYGSDVDPSDVLGKVVATLHQRGVALAGAIQHSTGSCSMALELLPSGLRMPISQDLGSGTGACRLDSGALAEAASLIRQSINAAPALVIFNKFGAQEAAGRGLHDEMVTAAMAGLPILTTVRDTLLTQWGAFTGGDAAQLPCTLDAALAWWDSLARRSDPAS